MENKKTSFILYPADFLAAVHNFRKNQVADLIISLCEFNLYGKVTCKLSEAVKDKFTVLQGIVNTNNAKYQEICEKRKASGSKGGSKRQANRKQTSSKVQANISKDSPRDSERESEKEKDSESENKFCCREPDIVDKPDYPGAPSIDEVTAYCKEIGIAIDAEAFMAWHNERGWHHGKTYIALDWQKAVRKWFCKDMNVPFDQFERDVASRQIKLGKGKEAQNG